MSHKSNQSNHKWHYFCHKSEQLNFAPLISLNLLILFFLLTLKYKMQTIWTERDRCGWSILKLTTLTCSKQSGWLQYYTFHLDISSVTQISSIFGSKMNCMHFMFHFMFCAFRIEVPLIVSLSWNTNCI